MKNISRQLVKIEVNFKGELMKNRFVLAFILLCITSVGWAETETSVTTAPEESYDNTPVAVATSDHSLSRKMDPKWAVILDVGAIFPMTSNFPNAYNGYGDLGAGVGYQFTDSFSLWLNLEGASFTSKNNALTGGYGFFFGDIALWARLDFGGRDVLHPYLFAGPGLAINEYDITSVVSGFNASTSIWETDFLWEAGLGLEFPLREKNVQIFAQSKFVYDYIGGNFGSFGGVDSPMKFIPVQIGVKVTPFL